MPVHLTKGDLARQPAMCAEIAALRATRNAHKHRLGYLNTKTSPSADEVAEKGPLETEIAKCDTAIGDLHQKVKSTASVDLNEAAIAHSSSHDTAHAAIAASGAHYTSTWLCGMPFLRF